MYIVQSVKYPATIIYSNISRSRIFPAYIVQGRRVIGYDNAEGKGDHRHYGDRIEPYRFEGLEKLAEDFYSDVQRYKEGRL